MILTMDTTLLLLPPPPLLMAIYINTHHSLHPKTHILVVITFIINFLTILTEFLLIIFIYN